MDSGIFRKQALAYQTDRLQGDVLVFPKLPHLAITSLLVFWLLLAIGWLVTSSYARKETVHGWLEPPEGVVRIYAESPGIIKQVLVAEGERVVKDQPLLVVNVDRMLDDGNRLEARLLSEYETQKKLLNHQLTRTETIYQQRLKALQKRLQLATEDKALLSEQLQTLNARMRLLQKQFQRYTQLAKEGNMSSLQVDEVQAQVLALQNEQQQLAREQVNATGIIEQLHTEKTLLQQEGENALGDVQARLSDIAQNIAQLNGQRAYIVKATRAGVVNSLQAREGQQAFSNNSIPLLTLVPENAGLVAHLLVPVRSVGFVHPGQTVDIRYDAFPYQKFGLYKGSLSDIAATVLLPNELLNTPVLVQEAVYRITANLDAKGVTAYGTDVPLKAGMTLSADIRLEERSLLAWLFEPIYSLKGRI